MMWCGGCYIAHPKGYLPNSGKNTERYWEVYLGHRYDKVREGDIMIMHFQYDLFHFQIMKEMYLFI